MKRTRKPAPPKTRISIDNRDIVEMVEDIKAGYAAKVSTTAVIATALRRWIIDIDAAKRIASQQEQMK